MKHHGSGDRWKDYWAEHPTSVGETEFLKQVDRTIGGKPVDDWQIDLIVDSIIDQLAVGSTDRVIDLCCGNGYLTCKVADRAQSVLGIDYSAPLIAVAEKYHRSKNVSYLCRSVLNLSDDLLTALTGCGKAYAFDALQYFSIDECHVLLASLASASAEGFVVLLCGIPDRERLFDFYNTPERRQDYERRLATGNEAVGTWWKTDELASLAKETGFDCEILPQDGRLYTAHYRFNARLIRRGMGIPKETDSSLTSDQSIRTGRTRR